MATIEELWRQVHNLTEQLAPVWALREALREPLDLAAEIARLQPQVVELEQMVATREDDLRTIERTTESARVVLDNLRSAVTDAEQTAAPIQAESRRLTAAKDQLAAEVADLELRRDRLAQDHATAASLWQAEIRALDRETAQRQAALDRINEAIAATKSAAAKL